MNKAIQLDRETYTMIAKYRSGIPGDKNDPNMLQTDLDNIFSRISFTMENYPQLQAHDQINQAIQQNRILQAEISAARNQYNDLVTVWNKEIFSWPTKQIVAAKQGYHTRIPFAASTEIRKQAKDVFF